MTYELELGLLETARTKAGCTCRPWRLQNFTPCATQANGWCCNPNHDPRGDWCITTTSCKGQAWDNCEPRPLRRQFQIRHAGGKAIGSAWLTSDFTGINPFETASGTHRHVMKLLPGWEGPSLVIAPLTKFGCQCVEPSAGSRGGKDCTVERGWCCSKSNERQSDWCWTKGACHGRSWDYCTPADTNRAILEMIGQ